jgi:ubiquinone/menaquinone biosynthesis C-methylase UbiE
MEKKSKPTSWENASEWYNNLVGSEGHYYHQHVIFPHLLKILKTKKQHLSMLDLGCGQGAFSQVLPEEFAYEGVDISSSFIKMAKKHNTLPNRAFHEYDLCQPFNLDKTFTHAAMILSLQNIADPKAALQNAKTHLKQGGTLLLVINHPCFRVPRQSSWEIDEDKKIQFRRIDTYMTPLEVPIDVHPGKSQTIKTLSFHYSLSQIFSFLQETGFTVASLSELCSDKLSTGKNAKMENKARKEIPLFMNIIAKSL